MQQMYADDANAIHIFKRSPFDEVLPSTTFGTIHCNIGKCAHEDAIKIFSVSIANAPF
jgi:hypothetical protein